MNRQLNQRLRHKAQTINKQISIQDRIQRRIRRPGDDLKTLSMLNKLSQSMHPSRNIADKEPDELQQSQILRGGSGGFRQHRRIHSDRSHYYQQQQQGYSRRNPQRRRRPQQQSYRTYKQDQMAQRQNGLLFQHLKNQQQVLQNIKQNLQESNRQGLKENKWWMINQIQDLNLQGDVLDHQNRYQRRPYQKIKQPLNLNFHRNLFKKIIKQNRQDLPIKDYKIPPIVRGKYGTKWGYKKIDKRKKKLNKITNLKEKKIEIIEKRRKVFFDEEKQQIEELQADLSERNTQLFFADEKKRKKMSKESKMVEAQKILSTKRKIFKAIRKVFYAQKLFKAMKDFMLEKREKIKSDMEQYWTKMLDSLDTVMSEVVFTSNLSDILEQGKTNFDVISTSGSKQETHFKSLKEFIDQILEGFHTLTTLEGFDLQDSEQVFGVFYLGYLCQTGSYFMQNYHFKFELDRMRFNTFGGSLYQGLDGDKRVGMIITILLIIRVFIIEFLFGLSEVQSRQTKRQKKNIKIVASIFQLLITKLFNNRCSTIQHNQYHLDGDLKIFPLEDFSEVQLQDDDDPNQNTSEGPLVLIPYLYDQDQLKYLFKQQTDQMKLWTLKIEKFGQKMIKNLREFYRRVDDKNALFGIQM